MLQLRPCQELAVRDSLQFINSGQKEGVIVLPTGAGKSIVIAEVIKGLGESFGNVLILQPSSTLLTQNYNKYISYGYEASIFSASLRNKNIGRVTFATPKSVVNSLDMFKNVKLIIIDEVHLASKEKNALGEIDKKFNAQLLGLTATPFVNSTTIAGYTLSFLQDSYQNKVKTIRHVTQVKDILQYWNPIKYLEPKTPILSTALVKNTTGADFTDNSLDNFYIANKLDQKILQSIEFLEGKGIKKILIFVHSIRKAKELAQKVQGSVCLHSELSSKEQVQIINGFKDGNIKVLINVGILGIGYDHPELDGIIHARPLGSFTLWYQHVGRLIRQYDTKKYLVDLSGNVQKFGKIEEIEIKKENGKYNLYVSQKRINKRVNIFKPEVINFPYKFKFGKYKNTSIGTILKRDSRYIPWMAFEYNGFTSEEQEAIAVCRNVIKLACEE